MTLRHSHLCCCPDTRFCAKRRASEKAPRSITKRADRRSGVIQDKATDEGHMLQGN